MSNYLQEEKYRISIKERTSLGLWGSFLDVDDLDELKQWLVEMKVNMISLKYYSILDDIPDWHEAGILVEALSEDHFTWLTTKVKGDSKFLEIDNKKK